MHEAMHGHSYKAAMAPDAAYDVAKLVRLAARIWRRGGGGVKPSRMFWTPRYKAFLPSENTAVYLKRELLDVVKKVCR